jgi:hypothetical protein
VCVNTYKNRSFSLIGNISVSLFSCNRRHWLKKKRIFKNGILITESVVISITNNSYIEINSKTCPFQNDYIKTSVFHLVIVPARSKILRPGQYYWLVEKLLSDVSKKTSVSIVFHPSRILSDWSISLSSLVHF